MPGIMMPVIGSIGQQGDVRLDKIPSLNLWYNASDTTTVVSGVTKNNFDVVPAVNGSSIGSWLDVSGSGHPSNVNGGTGKQPSYALPIQGPNGALQFTASSSNNLDINPTAWSQSLSGLTVYVVARPTSLPATLFPLVVTDTEFGIWWNGTNWTVGHSVGNYGTVSLTDDTSKFHIYGLVYDGTQSTNAGKMDFIYDLYEKTLTFTGTIGANTGTPSYWFFGGDNRGSAVNATFTGKFMDGYIGEIMI